MKAAFSSASFTTATGVAVAPNADITVRNSDTGTLANIWSDEAGTAPIVQPGYQADSSGRFEFYATGRDRGYDITVTKGAETYTLHHVAIGTAAQLDSTDFVKTSGSVIATFLQLTGDTTPATVTADQNDYAPTGHANTSVFRVVTDAQRSFTGLAGGSDGRIAAWVNVGSFNHRLVNESAASTAGNRFTLPNGDLILRPGETVCFIYDLTSTRWRLLAGPVNADTVPLPRSYLAGLGMANNGTDAINDIDIAAGECRSRDSTENLRLASALTKQLDVAWAVGSAAGGRDVGAIADGTWHLHLIKRPDTGVVDVLESLSAEGQATVTMTIASPCVVTYTGHGMVNGAGVIFSTTGALPTGLTAGTLYYVINRATDTFQVAATQGGAAINTSGTQSGVHTGTISPTMPANYTKRRRIGAIVREAGVIVAFSQDGDEFLRNASVKDVEAGNPGTSAVLQTLSVPKGIKVKARVNVVPANSAGAVDFSFYVSSPDQNDEAGSVTVAPGVQTGSVFSAAGGTQHGGSQLDVRTDTSGRIRTRATASDASCTLRIVTLGWVDQRGRDA